MTASALRFAQVTKEFPLGDGTVRALDGLTLDIPPGGFTAIVGRSGSGSSRFRPDIVAFFLARVHGNARSAERLRFAKERRESRRAT